MIFRVLLAVCVIGVASAAYPQAAFAQEIPSDLLPDDDIFGSDIIDDDFEEDFLPVQPPDLFVPSSSPDMDLPSPTPSLEQELPSPTPDMSDFFDILDNYFTVSGNNLSEDDSSDDFSLEDDYLDPLASYDAYYGSIGSTYVEYMRGYLAKLSPREHYVGARVSQYDYIFAYGEDLGFDGSFYGTGITVIRWNTRDNGAFYFVLDDNFELDPKNYLVYSDLSIVYPTLQTSGDMTLRQILYLLVISFLFMTMHLMYRVNKTRRLNRKSNGGPDNV